MLRHRPTAPDLAPSLRRDPGRESALRESPQGEIGIQLLTTTSEFASLAPDWNRLHAQARAASVFNSWIWQYQWWRVYGAGRPLRLLVARDGARTLGILALYIHRTRVLGVPVRMLRFVGTGADTNPDDLGPMLARGCEEEVALKLARAAMRIPDTDVAVLTDILPESPFAAALARAAAEAGRPSHSGDCERIAYLELPRTWPEYLASLNADRRRLVKGARKKAQAAHDVRFYVWEDSVRLDHAVDRLAELHRRRWAACGGSESFATREYIEFHRGIIRSSLARGWLRLYCLELDGELSAISYCYRFRNRVYLMQGGFDPDKARCNPGKALLAYAIEHAIGEGNEVFDFLRGDHRYKNQLATGHRTTGAVRVFRATPGGLAYRLRRIWLPLLKGRLLGKRVKLRP